MFKFFLVDDEELELFHFQKLEEEIIGNKGVDRIKTEQDQNYKKEKNSQGIKHVKVFQSRDREPLFQDVKWKSYTNVSGDKSDNSIIIDKDEKSHIESKALDRSPLISNTNFHNSSLNSLYSTQNINTNIHRTKIDLTFDTAPPKQKSRSNSVLMNRNIKDQVLNQGVTTQMRSNSNISKNDISMTTNEISNKIKPSSLLIPLQKMITVKLLHE